MSINSRITDLSHSSIVDDQPEKHRKINDAKALKTGLWSSYKINSLVQNASTVASSGFSWGRSGLVVSGSYLLNESVPSNIAGRTVPVSGKIVRVSVTCSSNTGVTINVEKKNGSSFIVLESISLVVGEKKKTKTSDIDVSDGDELAISVLGGSITNPIVNVIIRENA